MMSTQGHRHSGTLILASSLVITGMLSSKLFPQDSVLSAPKLLSRAPQTGYVLGAGDQINIRVVDLEEYSDKMLSIDPDGQLDLPLVGQIHAGGETIEAFKFELRRRLSKYVNSPQLSVNLLTNRSSKISVIGEVNSPGVRELSGSTSLIEAISEAGGLKTDAGSKVVITRSLDVGKLPVDGQVLDSSGLFSTVSLPLDELMISKRPADNFQLRPGDIVSVPKASIVYVVGVVHRSGGFPISSHSSMSVLQAISLAEGLTSNNASRSAKILRPAPGGDGKPTEIPVNVQAIFAGRDPDPPLFAEDILYIPHSTAEAGAKRAAEIVLQVATGVLIYR
jgi:polysaccharide export outer membrane protein